MCNKTAMRTPSENNNKSKATTIRYSVTKDAIGLCTPITPLNKIPYAHGGYASSAPMFVTDTKWMLILQHLMPHAHANLITLLNESGIKSTSKRGQSPNKRSANNIRGDSTFRIIKWAENNPIVTAFGFLFHRANLSDDEKDVSIEWDVFLDPSLVKHVDGAIQYLDNLTNTNSWSGGLVDGDLIAAAKVEVDRQISRLISRMVLSHGSTAQLAMEAAGVARSFNYSQVLKGGKVLSKKRARNEKSKYIRSEGIFVHEWLKLFAAAIQLGLQSENSVQSNINNEGKSLISMNQSHDIQRRNAHDQLITEPFLCGLLLCLGVSEPLSSTTDDYFEHEMTQHGKNIASLLGGNLKVVLDLKSRRVPSRVWSHLIHVLNSRNLVIDGIGSFDVDEVRNITNATTSKMRSIIFFHSAGDLQRACHENKVRKETIMNHLYLSCFINPLVS